MQGRLPIRWTRELDEIIREGAMKGMTKTYVAKILGVSATSVANRARALGLIWPSLRTGGTTTAPLTCHDRVMRSVHYNDHQSLTHLPAMRRATAARHARVYEGI